MLAMVNWLNLPVEHFTRECPSLIDIYLKTQNKPAKFTSAANAGLATRGPLAAYVGVNKAKSKKPLQH